MSIKVKIIILSVFSLVVTAMTGSILFQNSNQARVEIIKQGILTEILHKLSQQAILLDEYLLYHESRSAMQWNGVVQSIDKLLTRTSNVLPDEQILINKISDNVKATLSIFGNLVTNFNSQDNGPSATISEFEQRLISQLRIKSQESIDIASQLSNSSRSRVIESQNRTTLFVGVFFASSTIIILVVLYFIWLSIAKPLLVLKESALRIASLDFSTTTTTTTMGSNDEIGQLARAFNTMVVKLKESAAGKEDVRLKLVVATDKLVRQEKLTVMGKLAGIVGHEIRNPLGVIRNSIYFLTVKFKESMDEKMKRHMDIIQTEIDGCDKIISDILEFARTRPPSFTEAEINSVVEAALSKASIPKTVKVQTDLEGNLPKLNIDSAQIQQVFFNIISNAIEAMPKGGELQVTTSQTDTFISIAFKDTGVGIPKENISKLFEPLFSTKPKGLGLGLAACQNIISAHQGKIEFESKEGQGATFVIKLPIAQKVDMGQEKFPPEADPPLAEKISG